MPLPAPELRRCLVIEVALCALVLATVLRGGPLDALDLGVLLLPAHLHRLVAVRGRGLFIPPPAAATALLEAGALVALLVPAPDVAALLACALAALYLLHPGERADVVPFPGGRARDGLFLLLAGYGAIAASSLERLLVTTLASLAYLLVSFEVLDARRDPRFRATLRRLAACGLLFLLPIHRPLIQLALLALVALGTLRASSHSSPEARDA